MPKGLPIVVWFVGSILAYFVVDYLLRRFLKRQNMALTFLWLGTPGYLDMLYAKWCVEHKQLSYIPVIALRVLLIVSAFLSAASLRNLYASL